MSKIQDQTIQTYLGFAQNIIARLAGNSANAKTWCVTLVAGLLALAAGKPDNWHTLIKICFLPVILFCIIDMYYLYLEKYFRSKYDGIIVAAMSEKGLPDGELYRFSGPETTVCVAFFKTITSTSIWPFYAAQIGVLSYILWRV